VARFWACRGGTAASSDQPWNLRHPAIPGLHPDTRIGMCKMASSEDNAGGRGSLRIHGLSETVKIPAIEADRRDLRLDACRGLAQWFIFLDHVPDNVLAWLTLRNYGFSDTTEIFVFVSGYTCMIAYGGALRKQGWPTTVTRALRRGWEIYAAFLILLVVYLAVIWAVGGGSAFLDETNTAAFFGNPGTAIIHASILQYAPVNTDVLPTLVLLHLAFPGLLWLITRSTALALAASFIVYLLVQEFSWHVPAWPSGELYFNPLAFQVLFVFGAWYAYEGAVRLRTFVRSRTVLVLAVLYLVFSLAITLSWQIKVLEGFIPDAVSTLIYPIYKSHLAPVRLLHFLALAIVVSRLTPPDWHGLMKPLMMAMIRCGENSLAMYCLGVLLSFMGHVILVNVSGTIAMQVAVSMAGIAVMIAVATLMTWTSKVDRHGPKLF
jgi:hypothetical protein